MATAFGEAETVYGAGTDTGTPGISNDNCACFSGTFDVNGDASSCAQCAVGTWDDDADPATECVDCATCNAGEEATACTATADTVCTACADGTWDADGDGSTACVSCSTCNVGEEATACTATADTVCTACADGTWDDDEDPTTACFPCTACEGGLSRRQPVQRPQTPSV